MTYFEPVYTCRSVLDKEMQIGFCTIAITLQSQNMHCRHFLLGGVGARRHADNPVYPSPRDHPEPPHISVARGPSLMDPPRTGRTGSGSWLVHVPGQHGPYAQSPGLPASRGWVNTLTTSARRDFVRDEDDALLLTVAPRMVDHASPSEVIVREASNVTLSCRAQGHPEPRVTWRREDGGHIPYAGRLGEWLVIMYCFLREYRKM